MKRPLMHSRFIPFIIFLMAFNSSLTRSSAQVPADSSKVPVMTYRINDELEYQYFKPKAFAFAKNIIPSTGEYFKRTFTKKNFIYIGGMVTATAVLCLWDRAIIDGAHNVG